MPYKDSEKQRKYQRLWMLKRRQLWIETNGPCVFCGSDLELEVDHIDPIQKVDHRVWSWSQERRDTELAKCQVLCSDCHINKSNLQKFKPITHGTRTGYDRRCRCQQCTDANYKYTKLWRQRKKSLESGF